MIAKIDLSQEDPKIDWIDRKHSSDPEEQAVFDEIKKKGRHQAARYSFIANALSSPEDKKIFNEDMEAVLKELLNEKLWLGQAYKEKEIKDRLIITDNITKTIDELLTLLATQPLAELLTHSNPKIRAVALRISSGS